MLQTIEEIKRLRLRKGDIIVLELRNPASTSDIEALKQKIEHHIGDGYKVLPLDGGWKLSGVLEAAEIEEPALS